MKSNRKYTYFLNFGQTVTFGLGFALLGLEGLTLGLDLDRGPGTISVIQPHPCTSLAQY